MPQIKVPEELTALKFRGWLREMLSDIHARTSANEAVFVRLCMTNRLRHQITQRTLDIFLQRAVERHPRIFRIELELAEHEPTLAEMERKMDEAKPELDALAKELAEVDEWML